MLPVSVLIVNYNAGDSLAHAVTSALAQADEVIVVDNASHDDSLQSIVRRSDGDGRLSVIPNPRNLGFARGCNIGAGIARHQFLFFLNPDCDLGENAVNSMCEVLQHPAVGMVGGLLCNPDGTEQAGGRRLVPTPWRTFVRAFGLGVLASRYPRLFRGYDLHGSPIPPGPIEVEAISGACMMVKREAVEVVGLLDEGYFMHCEDIDWCMRFRQAGWKIMFVPSALIRHDKGGCSKTRPLFVEWHKHKGMVRFYRKFFRHQYPGALMWLVMIAVWLRFGAIVCKVAAGRVRPRRRGLPVQG